MEDSKKGNGLFLAIVGVATLIVAIIGASFAYFSAQASSTEGAVNLSAYEFNASLSLSEVYASNNKLIPVNPDGAVENATAPNNTIMKYALNVAKSCNDSQGYRICALYQVTITNGGATALTLDGTIVTNSNTASERDGASPFTNLTYRPVTKDGQTYTIGATATTLVQTDGGITNIGQVTVPANDSLVTYALIYLNENDNQSAEMGATYTGQLVYTSTAGSGSRLTGTFTIGGGN